MKRISVRPVHGLALALILSGCANQPPIVKVTRTLPVAAPATATATAVQLFKQAEPVTKPYEILGVVTALPSGSQTIFKDRAAEPMRAAAAQLGSDALIAYYEGREPMFGGSWASGLAVRFATDERPPVNSVGNFMVAVPQLLLGDAPTPDDRRNADIARNIARMMLARRGYYAVLVDKQPPSNIADGFNAMDASELEAYGNRNANLVLAMEFAETRQRSYIIGSGQTNTIEVLLYSKSDRKITWQGVGGGSGGVGWMMNMFLPDAKKALAIQSALDEAFKSLPDISTRAAP